MYLRFYVGIESGKFVCSLWCCFLFSLSPGDESFLKSKLCDMLYGRRKAIQKYSRFKCVLTGMAMLVGFLKRCSAVEI